MKRIITHYPRSLAPRPREIEPGMNTVVFMLAAWMFLRDERGGWFLPLLIGLALNIVAYLLMPRPKKEQPPAAQQGETPVASVNIPIPRVVGTVIVKELNVIDYRDKGMLTYTIDI